MMQNRKRKVGQARTEEAGRPKKSVPPHIGERRAEIDKTADNRIALAEYLTKLGECWRQFSDGCDLLHDAWKIRAEIPVERLEDPLPAELQNLRQLYKSSVRTAAGEAP